MGIIKILVIINIITFFMYGYDKWAAKSGKDRVSEKTLFMFTLLGGTLGAIIGMNIFKHKRKKKEFIFVIALIIIVQLLLVYWIFNNWEIIKTRM